MIVVLLSGTDHCLIEMVSVKLAFRILAGHHQWDFIWCLWSFFPECIKEKVSYVSVSSSSRLRSQPSPLFHGSELLSDLSQGPIDLQIWTLLEGLFTQRAVANLTTQVRKENREETLAIQGHKNPYHKSKFAIRTCKWITRKHFSHLLIIAFFPDFFLKVLYFNQ